MNSTFHYSSEPAPMGIGDFGVGAGGNAYTYSTTEFLGNFSWQSLHMDESGNTEFTDQLNVVLQFVQDGVTYAYWIQDVAFMDSATGDIGFENNIWNFTNTCMDSSAVSGNGSVNMYNGCQEYYAVEATVQPGASRTMPSPGDFGLLVRSYETGAGVPEVAFEYWDGVTSWYVTYDNVVFPWATAVSSDNNFVVDGSEYNPLGLFYDAELTIGGPGGGAATQAQPTTDATSRLLYWNGHNFEAPPSVWNFGSNTAEAVSNIQSIFSHDGAGLPLTLQLNGTTRNATPAKAYDQNRVGELAITASGMSAGTVAIPGDNWSFVGDSATLTLLPGAYHVWVNSTSQHYDLGFCAVQAGVTSSISTATTCGPLVSTPTSSAPGADLGQSVTFYSTLESPGTGGDSYVWDTDPTGLGCSASTTLTLSCTPVSTGTYTVNVTVTDSASQSTTSGTLRFTVSSDPTVGIPTSTASEVETGESVTFLASPSGGAQPFSYSWTGLPAPCFYTGTSSPTCTPGTVGSYSVGVTVTDANGLQATSPSLAITVLLGPSITTPSATPSGTADVGENVTFSTSASGGSGGYTYSWSGLPTGCSSVSSATILCVPTAAGAFSVSAKVVDSLGGSATSGALSYTVISAPTIGILRVAPSSVDVGQKLHFFLSAASTGGAGSYRYVWTGLPSGCNSTDAITLTCTPTAADAGWAAVTVYDANNGSNSSRVSFQVFPDPSLSALSALPGSVDLGQAVTISAVGLAGGSGTFTYRWSGLPAGCTSVNALSVACSPAAVGTSEITLNITDSNEVSVERTLVFTVDSDLAVGTPTATPGSVTTGQGVTFSVSVSGGSGSYTYLWSGLPVGCSSVNASTVTCQPSAAGTSDVTVNVTDSNGARIQSGTLPFIVGGAPATFLGLPALEGYLLAAAVAGLVVVILAVVLVRRSRRRESSPP